MARVIAPPMPPPVESTRVRFEWRRQADGWSPGDLRTPCWIAARHRQRSHRYVGIDNTIVQKTDRQRQWFNHDLRGRAHNETSGRRAMKTQRLAAVDAIRSIAGIEDLPCRPSNTFAF